MLNGFNDFNNKDKLQVFALGGLNEIGKNCYIVEKGNEILIIDAGIKFLGFDYNLANAIIPNFEYIEKNKEKVKGIFITHGHEDHVGSISYLLNVIPNVPIYGSDFSIAIVKQKLRNNPNPKCFSLDERTTIKIGDFKVSFFRVTHSIPGSFGVFIETSKKRIILTGDFKFDWTTIGESTDILKLAEYGKKGVDLLLSDSTNAEVKGTTPSEAEVIERLRTLIFEAQGRVIITSFASNVYRLKKIIEIAKQCEKKIVLLGSSILRMMEVIKKASLWKIDSSAFLDVERINLFPKNKLIIICTGSQGEERAVLSRMANKRYNELNILKGDSVILTSSPIMDNRYKLESINNKLFYELGANIYENGQGELLHSSGHACKEDLKLMLKLVNPTHFMPFHGDHRMLKSHAKLAEKMGIEKEKIFVCKNGQKISSVGDDFKLENELINTKPDYIFDQKVINGKIWDQKTKVREQMLRTGVFIVLIFKDEKKNLILLPHIFTYGFINIKENKNLINNWKFMIFESIKNKEGYNEIKSTAFEVVNSIFESRSELERPSVLVIVDGS